MSEQKYTPGPWLTVKSKPNRVRDESGVIITQVSMPPTKLGKAAWMKGKEISHANARLIAAAPDMLEALLRQQANIKRWLETGIPADEDESESISGQIDAAISKALAP